MKRCLLLLCCCFATLLSAQTTQISGTLHGAEGREMLLLTVTDYLTEEPLVLARQTIQPDGTFSFTFTNDQIQPVTLMVAFHRTDLFAVPNFHHELHGAGFTYDDRLNPFIAKPQLPLQFSKEDTLNRYIIDFEQRLERWEYQNLQDLREKTNVRLLDTLQKMPQQIPNQFVDFYQRYVQYTIATHQAGYYLTKPMSLGKRFLDAQNPQLTDFCYMRFFHAYFDNYLPNRRSNMALRDIHQIISQRPEAPFLLDFLGSDSMLRNEDVRELFLLKLIMEHFPSNKNSVKVLESLSQTTRFPEHRTVAQRIIEIITRWQPKTKAPEFSLPQADGTIVHSKNLKDKYLYIIFFKSNCTGCLTDMEQMRAVYERNKDFFEFIAISLDDKKSDFLAFTKHYNYPWKMLYAGNDWDFIQQWQPKTLPLQALLSKDYKIIEYPASNIQEGIISKIEKMSWEENRNRRQQRKP